MLFQLITYSFYIHVTCQIVPNRNIEHTRVVLTILCLLNLKTSLYSRIRIIEPPQTLVSKLNNYYRSPEVT